MNALYAVRLAYSSQTKLTLLAFSAISFHVTVNLSGKLAKVP